MEYSQNTLEITENSSKKKAKDYKLYIKYVFKKKENIEHTQSPLEKSIFFILNECLNNNKENIDTIYLEDYLDERSCPNVNISDCLDKYIYNYFLLIRSIKHELLENKDIIKNFGNEILKHLEDIKDKKELKIYQINIILEFIFKSTNQRYSHLTETEVVERAVGISNNYYLNTITSKSTGR